jgi:hypothetical protein
MARSITSWLNLREFIFVVIVSFSFLTQPEACHAARSAHSPCQLRGYALSANATGPGKLRATARCALQSARKYGLGALRLLGPVIIRGPRSPSPPPWLAASVVSLTKSTNVSAALRMLSNAAARSAALASPLGFAPLAVPPGLPPAGGYSLLVKRLLRAYCLDQRLRSQLRPC